MEGPHRAPSCAARAQRDLHPVALLLLLLLLGGALEGGKPQAARVAAPRASLTKLTLCAGARPATKEPR